MFSCTFQKYCKTYPHILQFQFKSGTLKNVQIPLNLNSYTCRLTEPNFGAKIAAFEKFQSHI